MSAAIVGSVLDHSGVVHSALDDSIVAVFGLSRASSRDVDKAISCALNIKRKVADNNAGTLDEGGLNMAIQVRIGVHVGEIMTGDVDSAFLGNTDPVLLQSIGSNLEYNLQHDALADVKHLADAARNYPSPCIFMR
jgi:class 3 adenylate cyclase